MAATLSIGITAPNKEIAIASVQYFDTKGDLTKDYLEDSVTLKPMATAEFSPMLHNKDGQRLGKYYGY